MRWMRVFLLLACAAAMGACTGGKVYDHYEHTLVAGWDRADSLSFSVPPVAVDGRYATALGLRISSAYPYRELALVVRQTVVEGRRKARTTVDTLHCTLFSERGIVEGRGIGTYQYTFRVSELALRQGDSIHVTVSHIMRREIMPGVTDVGIEIDRQ